MTTLQNLLDLLRQRTNMEKNQFVTDLELTTYLNNSLCLLDGLLIIKFNDYKLTSIITTVVTGKDYIALPLDFLKMKGLDVVLNPNTPDGYLTLKQFSFQQRNKRPINGPAVFGPYQLEYRLEGNQIKIIPGQSAGQWNYRLWYVPDYVPLVNTTDTLQTYMDSQAWYEYAIADSAVKILAKQNMDPSTFATQAAELKNHIMTVSAPNRNIGEPASVVDSRGSDISGGYGWNW